MRCVRESLCTAGVWPLRDPLGTSWYFSSVMQVVLPGLPCSQCQCHCHILPLSPGSPLVCTAPTLEVPDDWLDGSGPVRVLKGPKPAGQDVERQWDDDWAGGYLAHRSICKTPLKVLSKAVKLWKRFRGFLGDGISPSGCVSCI